MRATVIHGPFDIRVEQRPDPVIEEPTDALVRTVAACVCGSDPVSYTHLRAHETVLDLVCRLLLEKKKLT